jgi:predicted RNA-binding Zn-ribbon protein involved in translation (DUF1610 family)
MLYTWNFAWKSPAFEGMSVSTHTSMDLSTKNVDEAIAALLADKRYMTDKGVKRENITAKRGGEVVETLEELGLWLKMNNLTFAQAQGGAQVMYVNGRTPHPFPCPNCKVDINNKTDGPDKVGNAYYCPKCHYLLQVG